MSGTTVRTFESMVQMLRIGLSWHGGDREYDAYKAALLRRAQELEIPISITWLAGQNLPDLTAELQQLNGICFTGGEDLEPHRYGRSDALALCATNPGRDEIEWSMLGETERLGLPILAICRGAQLLNVFHGGTLVPDLGERNDVHRAPPEKEHDVEILPQTLLRSLAGTATGLTNSSHHQAVDNLAEIFRQSAISLDGTIEAFEPWDSAMIAFCLAVQWHPELMMPGLPLADAVLDGLLRAAAVRAPAS